MASKLTDTSIEKLRGDPAGKQLIEWDSDTRGLGVLVSKATRTFIVQRRLNDGRSRRITIGPVQIGIKDARVRAARLIADMAEGVDPKVERRKAAAKAALTLQAALDRYVENKTGNTAAAYRKAVETRFAGWLSKPLREIDGGMVSGRYKDIMKEATHPGRVIGGGTNNGVASANFAMRVLSAIYRHADKKARREGEPLPPNPVEVLTEDHEWRKVAPRENVVKADDLPAFYAGLDGLSNRVAADCLKLILFTGLRRTEATALRWSEVDLAARAIRLPSARTKAGRPLALPMSSFVHDLLVARRALGMDGDYVFPAARGKGPIQELKYDLDRVVTATGVQATVHDLRRSFVTHAESCEISILALKALVNHAIGGDVTEDYVRMAAERLRAPAQRVCDYLMELCRLKSPTAENVTRMSM